MAEAWKEEVVRSRVVLPPLRTASQAEEAPANNALGSAKVPSSLHPSAVVAHLGTGLCRFLVSLLLPNFLNQIPYIEFPPPKIPRVDSVFPIDTPALPMS